MPPRSGEELNELESRQEPRLVKALEMVAPGTALRDGLTSCIGCGCLSLRRCRLSNPNDTAAGYGAGARYLPPALRRPLDATLRSTPHDEPAPP